VKNPHSGPKRRKNSPRAETAKEISKGPKLTNLTCAETVKNLAAGSKRLKISRLGKATQFKDREKQILAK
jgi:hypothetical protein